MVGVVCRRALTRVPEAIYVRTYYILVNLSGTDDQV
jgi:hypothetical protein